MAMAKESGVFEFPLIKDADVIVANLRFLCKDSHGVEIDLEESDINKPTVNSSRNIYFVLKLILSINQLRLGLLK